MFSFENLRNHIAIHDKMKELLREMAKAFPNEETARNFLQRLAFMHVCVATEIEISENCKSNMGISQFYGLGDCQGVITKEGLPADWACSIYHLFFKVHHYLKYKNQFASAILISNYILKNYAYKLSGTKRIAFVANFFASVHYDYEKFSNGSFVIVDMGRYILEKFDNNFYTYIPENRVYLLFVRLILADLSKRFNLINWTSSYSGRKPQKTLCEVLIDDSEIHRPILDPSIRSLWTFLNNCYDMILNDKTLRDYMRDFALMNSPACHTRWRKAIVAGSFYSHHDRKFVASVALWRCRIVFAEEQFRHESKYDPELCRC